MNIIRLSIIPVAALLSACAGISNPDTPASAALASPGAKMIASPAEIAASHHCQQKKSLPVQIEASQIFPVMRRPGEKFTHRFIYTLCPGNPVIMSLHRRIYFNGIKPYWTITKGFEFKPGKWRVDANIMVPLDALPGAYSLWLEAKASRTRTLRTHRKTNMLTVSQNVLTIKK